jgi:lysophospholipase L1-like esterase
LKKTILCFGDSNTWGYNPVDGTRYPKTVRWTGILATKLGDSFEIIEEGLNGRTTIWDDPIEGYKNGKEYLIPCLESHKPLDLIIILLGTNDLKHRFSLTSFDIAEAAGILVKTVQNSDVGLDGTAPEILLLAPPKLSRLSGDSLSEFKGGVEKSQELSNQYERVANQFGCMYSDLSGVVVSSDIDGVHLEPEEHKKIGEHVARFLKIEFV